MKSLFGLLSPAGLFRGPMPEETEHRVQPGYARGVADKFNEFVGSALALEPITVDHSQRIASVDDLWAALADLGWPEPTERTPTSFRWAAATECGVAQVAAWYGPELERVGTGDDGQPQFNPTGRSGIFITGERALRATLGEALASLAGAFERSPDDLLALFGLKHDHVFPGSPVVPLEFNPDHNQRGEMLRSIGQV